MGMPVEELEPLEDPRHENAERHSLHDIPVIVLCTIPCRGETCTGMALFGHSKREFPESLLPLRSRITNHDTFSKVFRLLDPEAFRKVVSEVHGPVCPRLRGCAGHRRQDAAALL